MQEYYTAQCTNTKLKYERKQLERIRDQLLGQWRMHDAVVCQRTSSSSPLHDVSSSTRQLSTQLASTFDLLSSFPAVASASTASEELDLFSIGSPFDIEEDDDDDDTDDSDDDEEDTDIISESVMADLSDIYDPLSRSLTSCPAAAGAADRDYTSLMSFDVPSLSVFDEQPTSTSRTAASAGQAMTPPTRGLAGNRVQSSARSRSLSLTSVEPAVGQARQIHSETPIAADAWTTATQCTSTTTTQSSVSNIPLHVRSLSSDRDDDD